MHWEVIGLAATLAVLPLALLGWLVWAVRRRNAAVASRSERLHSAIICPLCHGEMAPGFVMAGRGIHWRDVADAPIGLFATVFSVLPNTISIAIPPRENRAWRCAACSFVGVDHSALLGSDPR
jgi:hypothetical protein